MVQRVTVSPSEVRGYGDIVSPKTTEDFYEYMCSVTESDGVYTMEYENITTYLRLNVSPPTTEYGYPVSFNATLMIDGELVSGETVSFYEGETLLGTAETNSSGVATLTTLSLSATTHTVKAVYEELESGTVSVTVLKLTPTISLSADKSTVFDSESFTLSGVLSVGSGQTVKLYENNVFVKNLTTVTDGAFTETITGATGGTHTYKVVFEGSAIYESVTSSNASVKVIDSSTPHIQIGVTGNSFSTSSSSPFTYTGDVFVDWGDNNGEVYDGGALSHNYSSSSNYTIKVYGTITGINNSCFAECSNLTSVILPDDIISLGNNCFFQCTNLTSITLPDTIVSLGNNCFSLCSGLTSITLPDTIVSLGEGCFGDCTGLTSVTIPDSVGSIGDYCFYGCTALTEIVLNWDTSSEIVTYNSAWINGSSFDHFLIPEGTKALYEAKSYPSALLKEDGVEPASITLTGTKNILSYADSESSVLTATVLDDNNDPVEGVSVDLYKDNVLWDTLTTSSAGTVSKTYTSAGIGDVGFTAECGSLVTENFPIQDIYLYDELTSAKHSWTNTNGTSNQSYSSNGMTVTGNSNGAILVLDETLPSTYSAEVTITALSPPSNNASKGGGLGLENSYIQPNNSNCTIMKLGSGASWFDVSEVINVNDVIKMIYDGSKVEFYKGTTKLGEIAKGNGANVGFGIRNLKVVNGTSDSITIKDLKIKQL